MKTLASFIILSLLSCTAHGLETPLVLDTHKTQIQAAVVSPFDKFSASLVAYEAVISVDPAEKRVGMVQLRFRFTDLKTGDRDRDTAMRSWQQTDQYPDCVFTMETLHPVAPGRFEARGRLLLHGISRPLVFPVAIAFNGETCVIDGSYTLDVRDHGLPIHRRFGLLKVAPTVQISFHLQGLAKST